MRGGENIYPKEAEEISAHCKERLDHFKRSRKVDLVEAFSKDGHWEDTEKQDCRCLSGQIK